MFLYLTPGWKRALSTMNTEVVIELCLLKGSFKKNPSKLSHTKLLVFLSRICSKHSTITAYFRKVFLVQRRPKLSIFHRNLVGEVQRIDLNSIILLSAVALVSQRYTGTAFWQDCTESRSDWTKPG